MVENPFHIEHVVASACSKFHVVSLPYQNEHSGRVCPILLIKLHTMKRLNTTLFSILFALISFSLTAQTSKTSVCGYYGDNAKYNRNDICDYLSFASNSEAEEKVDDILRQVGLKRNFIVMECPNIENALAVNLPSDIGLLRYIIYDNKFLEGVNSTTNTDWAATSILAHEIGHHLNGHSLDGTGSRPSKELEADEFSGFVLFKLGATLYDAQAAMRELQGEKGSSTHPAKSARLAAIKKGWDEAHSLSGGVSRPKSTPSTADNATLAKQWFEKGVNEKSARQKIIYYDKAIELKPSYSEAYNNRGVAYYGMGKYDQALADYSQAIRYRSDYARAYCNRGLVYKRKKQYDQALADYGKAIQYQPDYSTAYNNRGLLYDEQKKFQLAINDYDKAIQYDPKFKEAYNNRGVAKKNLARYESAIADYDAALALDAEYPRALANKGCALVGLKRYGEGVDYINRALKLDPNLVYSKSCKEEALRELMKD